MTYKIDHNNTLGDGIIPEGDYEVIVMKAAEEVTKGGVQHISLDLVVRNDIVQSHKNSHVWAKVWKSKEKGVYSMPMINTIGKALNIPNGKEYASFGDMLADFDGKTCLIKVKHEEYNGYTNAKVVAWSVSHHQQCHHVWNEKTAGTVVAGIGQEIVFSNDDCPF